MKAKNIYTIFLMELKKILNDRRFFTILLVAPVVIITLIGFVVYTSPEEIDITVFVDKFYLPSGFDDRLAREFINEMDRSESFSVTQVNSLEEAKTRLHDGETRAYMIILMGPGGMEEEGQIRRIDMELDAKDYVIQITTLSELSRIFKEYSIKILQEFQERIQERVLGFQEVFQEVEEGLQGIQEFQEEIGEKLRGVQEVFQDVQKKFQGLQGLWDFGQLGELMGLGKLLERFLGVQEELQGLEERIQEELLEPQEEFLRVQGFEEELQGLQEEVQEVILGLQEGFLETDIKTNVHQEMELIDFFASPLVILVMMLLCFVLAPIGITSERARGTIERFFTIPYKNSEIIIGKMLAYDFFALIIAILILATMVLGFDVIIGNIFLFLLITSLVGFFTVSLGLLISSVTYSELESLILGFVTFLCFLVLMTFLSPFETMHPAVESISRALPVTHANIAIKEVTLLGYGFSEVWGEILILCISIVLLTAAAIWGLKRVIK